MQFLADLACPLCHGDLSADGESLACAVCGAAFPVIHGIPDLRPSGLRSVYYDDPAELAALIAAYPASTYDELEEVAYGKTLTAFHAAYRQAAEVRGEDNWAEMERLAQSGDISRQGALDIGCGPGGNLVTLAKRFGRAVGIDVNFKNLLLAKKRIEERGLAERAVVVAASADALPFRNELFDYVTAMNVIEHVEEQRGTLAEVFRVLSSGGAFFFDSPNRFTLLPEPHVKLWGVGFLPRQWADPYVRMRLGHGYEGKRLLSLRELRGMLRRDFGSRFRIAVPSFEERAYFPEGALKKLARVGYNQAFRRLPVVSDVLFPFVPTYHVLATKG